MAELLNHQHCKQCDRATPFGDDLCSDACRESWAAFQKKRARTMLLFYGGSAFLLILLLVQLADRFR